MTTTPGLGRPAALPSTLRAGKVDGQIMRDAERQQHSVSAEDLSEAALRCTDAHIRGAILAVASLDDGMSLTDAARTWRVDVATLRDVIRRLDESGRDGLRDLIAPHGAGTGGNRIDSSNLRTRS